MRFLTLTILMVTANSVLAESLFEKLDKFYVGGGVNFVDSHTNVNGNNLNYSTLELLGGYKYNGFLGVEARVGFGLADEETTDETTAITTETSIGYHGSIYWRTETANDIAKIYGLLGYSTISVDIDAGTSSDSESESGLSYGGGVGFVFEEKWNLNFEYRLILDDDENEFSALSANVDFRF